ncbi:MULTISPECIES: DUF4907 domain-containing protein [Spirosoma]|uniref:DUF4907 domain-containing protein n=1 Tax=Spirosoma liriopis TaxID=2937440 RepID=A0ABT0HNS9_9BACT|nr:MULTISPECIES: DUF4907 domain-containing protein [Spirosoma]MCK8493298.1 DUF4907 domain-containing protein [Spirosoma liriopis]UHG92689.1 DUF4907 domain-containing protein [Spirosoma oryzicola]
MSTAKPSRSQQRTPRSGFIRTGLLLIILGLALITGYLFYSRQPHYRVEVFKAPNGWGYDIVNNGKAFIHQPTIPGVPGMVGFANEDQARRVGERAVEKLERDKELPTLTHDELRQLGVNIP